MNCIEEIINIPILLERFNQAAQRGALQQVLTEIVIQSRVEFNLERDNEAGKGFVVDDDEPLSE